MLQHEIAIANALLHGKSFNQISETLKLSQRTINFIIKNLMLTLKCKTMDELLQYIQDNNYYLLEK